MEFLQKALEFLTNIDGSVIMTAGIVVEVVFRLVKTDKPRSLLLMAAQALEAGGKVAIKAAELINKVIPQRLK